MEVYQSIYPVNQQIMLGKPVVFKDQRVGRIKQSDIEVQIYTITGGKNLAISEIVLFDDPSNKWRTTGRVADVLKW